MPVRRSERLRRCSLSRNGVHPVADPRRATSNLAKDTSFPPTPVRHKRKKGEDTMWNLHPSGMEPARWESHPQRSTYFLKLLATEKREGRLPKGSPGKAIYDVLQQMFWENLQVRHDSSQFKNHYTTKKKLWQNVYWARKQTGTSWDDGRKMVIADPSWWENAKANRPGLSVIEGKPIPDYDLLEFVFSGQHAEGAYLHDPTVPRSLPQVRGTQQSTAEFEQDGMEVESNNVDNVGSSERNTTSLHPSPAVQAKKKRMVQKTSISPREREMREFMGCYFEMKKDFKERSKGKSVDSVNIEMKETDEQAVVRILIKAMGLDTTSDFFHDAAQMLEHSSWKRTMLISQDPETRLAWLQKALNREQAGVSQLRHSIGSGRYDLNRSPNK